MRYFGAVPLFALATISENTCPITRVETSLLVSGAIPVAAADLDGDGLADLVAGHRWTDAPSGDTYAATALVSRGDGTFEQRPLEAPHFSVRGVLLADVNDDKRPDVVTRDMAADGLGEVLVHLGRGDGTFGPPVRVPTTSDTPRSFAVADMDGDRIPDIITAGGDPRMLDISRGCGDGTFVRGPAYPGVFGFSLAAADVDQDGRPDVVLMDSHDRLSVHLNDGAGGLRKATTYPIGGRGDDLVLADLTGDGQLDAVIASAATSSVRVLPGGCDGAFAEAVVWPVDAAPRALAVGRFNDDAWLDVITVSPEDSSVSVLLGRSDGRIERGPQRVPVGAGAASVALADLTGDGRLEIVTGNPQAGTVTALIPK